MGLIGIVGGRVGDTVDGEAKLLFDKLLFVNVSPCS